MKVKIKTNVPPGKPGVTYFGHTYKWHGVYYDMGMEYPIAAEDFNPDIMVSLEPAKKVEAPPLPEVILPEAATEEEEAALEPIPPSEQKEEVKTRKKGSKNK